MSRSIVEIKFYDMLSKLLNPKSDKAMQIGWALVSQNPAQQNMYPEGYKRGLGHAYIAIPSQSYGGNTRIFNLLQPMVFCRFYTLKIFVTITVYSWLNIECLVYLCHKS